MAKPKDIAVRIAEAIQSDLEDRCGMWPDDLDREIKREIRTSWIRVIKAILTDAKGRT